MDGATFTNTCGDVQQPSSAPAQPSVPTSSEESSNPSLFPLPSSRTHSLTTATQSRSFRGPFFSPLFPSSIYDYAKHNLTGAGAVVVVAAGRLLMVGSTLSKIKQAGWREWYRIKPIKTNQNKTKQNLDKENSSSLLQVPRAKSSFSFPCPTPLQGHAM